jgi:hypothetical protein
MCLNFLEDLTDELNKKDDMIVAYKVVLYNKTTKRFIPCHMNTPSSNLKSGKWRKAKYNRTNGRKTIYTGSRDSKYELGFHCLITLNDAINYADEYPTHSKRIIKVYLKGITTTGVQRGCKSVVARRMFVPSQEVKNNNGKRCRGLKI